MFRSYYYDIEYSKVSDEDKKILKDFLELLDKYKYEPDKLVSFAHEELSHIFEIAKIDPRLQIEIWHTLPNDVVNNAQNLEIFEGVLENKFGEYIHGIDKKSLVELLNSSRYPTRSNG